MLIPISCSLLSTISWLRVMPLHWSTNAIALTRHNQRIEQLTVLLRAIRLPEKYIEKYSRTEQSTACIALTEYDALRDLLVHRIDQERMSCREAHREHSGPLDCTQWQRQGTACSSVPLGQFCSVHFKYLYWAPVDGQERKCEQKKGEREWQPNTAQQAFAGSVSRWAAACWMLLLLLLLLSLFCRCWCCSHFRIYIKGIER